MTADPDPEPLPEGHITDSEFCWRGLPRDKPRGCTLTRQTGLTAAWSERQSSVRDGST
jgi:hypothetical protein